MSDKDIKKRLDGGDLVIDPLDKECVQPSTYDIHLGDQFRVYVCHKSMVIDMKEKTSITELVDVSKEGKFVLHPSEFVLATTVERVEIPDDIAVKLEGKSSLGRLGLVIHSTAGFIDPGFKGYITFHMSNVNRLPIVLYPGMKIGQLIFFQMTSKAERPYGTAGNKYQNQVGPTESMAWKDFVGEKG